MAEGDYRKARRDELLKPKKAIGAECVSGPTQPKLASAFGDSEAPERRPPPRDNPFDRALQGAIGGLWIGALVSVPAWVRARQWRPPKEVVANVTEIAGMSAASGFVECSVERIRGRDDDVWAPLLGMAVPRVTQVAVETALKKRRGEEVKWKATAKKLLAGLAFPVVNAIVFHAMFPSGLPQQSTPLIEAPRQKA